MWPGLDPKTVRYPPVHPIHEEGMRSLMGTCVLQLSIT